MNLFWKSLFGGITSTSKLEQQQELLFNSMQRYQKVESSTELAEYKTLLEEVSAHEFMAKKKSLLKTNYKDTEEYRTSKRFQQLANLPAIKTYFSVLASEELEKYQTFAATPEYEDLHDKKLVKASEELQSYKRFEQSKEYKIYVKMHQSQLLNEYEELKSLVESSEFQSTNEFWSNPKRWETTEEYVKDQRFNELSQFPDIQFYNTENPEKFEYVKKLKKSFFDSFEWSKLEQSKWMPGFYKPTNLISNHSFTNELQANNGGKNVSVVDGELQIATVKESIEAKAWDVKKGFVMKNFDFTSDVIQTGAKFRQTGGEFSAKIRCVGKANHAFWLGADNKEPHVNIFHFDGKRIHVGIYNQGQYEGVSIGGLNVSKSYIYKLIWTETEMVWYINNLEVFRTSSLLPKEEMYLVLNSFLKQKATEASLFVEWVKVNEF